MKCYNHPEKDSVGVCKSCQKGICMECSTLIDGSLACKDTCKEDVAVLNYIIGRGRKEYENLSSNKAPIRLLSIICGVIFLGFGIYYSGKTASWPLLGLGLIMAICGVLDFIKGRKIADRNDSK